MSKYAEAAAAAIAITAYSRYAGGAWAAIAITTPCNHAPAAGPAIAGAADGLHPGTASEAIAKTAREVNDWDLAEYAATQMLEHDANYAGTHLALALVAEHKSDNAKALEEYKMAEKLWSDADANLFELSQIKTKVAVYKNKAQ